MKTTLTRILQLAMIQFVTLTLEISKVYAIGTTTPEADNPDVAELPTGTGVNEGRDLIEAIGTIINWALGFVGIVIFIIFLFAGFQYATAGGDESKTNNARSSMVNAVIGLIIVFLAFVISNAVLAFAFGVR